MATTPCRFSLGYDGEPDGTVDLYPEGSDTAAASGLTFSEESNRSGMYGFDVTQSLTGRHWCKIKDSAGDVIGSTWFALADTTSEHYPVSRADNRDGNKLAGENENQETNTELVFIQA